MALKLLHGERPDRVNLDEPQGEPGAPPAPEGMDVAVGQAYDALVAVLEPTRMLSHLDGPALHAFAQVLVEHQRAADLVNTVGPLVRDEHGQPRVNPAYRIRRDAGRDVLRWATEFGMTPASRSQIRARLAGQGAAPLDPVAARYLTGGAT